MIIKYNNLIMKYDDKWLNSEGTPQPTPVDPYNPLNLPPNIVRVRTSDGNPPYNGAVTSYETATLVPGTTDVYDVYKSGTDFEDLLTNATTVIEVLGANTTNITKMTSMFQDCYNLRSVALFDTSNVTNMVTMFAGCSNLTSVPLFDTSSVTETRSMFSNCTSLVTVPLFVTSNLTNTVWMFNNCTSLISVPLFDTSKVSNMREMFNHCSSLTSIPLFDTTSTTNMTSMFYGCVKVETGALALYQQASSQTNPPSSHNDTFYQCGKNTQTGAAELAQIPSDWK